MKWYAGRKVVITGGSSGIGKAAAVLLARWGADCAIIARSRATLDAAEQEMRAVARDGARLCAVACDVTDRRRLASVVPDIVSRLGGVDVLINCAGIAHPGYLERTPDEVWDALIAVDYMGTVNATRAFLPHFLGQKRGHIANVSSVAGYMGVFGYAAYSAAKFAVVGFSECLRQDLLGHGITVSVLYPPDTDTRQWHEENRIKPPETRQLAGTIHVMPADRVARALLAGIARGRFRILPGAGNRFVYFANRHLPGVVWWVISRQLRSCWRRPA